MLENTMMAANIIQYCLEQVRHVQRILFVEKIAVALFIFVHVCLSLRTLLPLCVCILFY